MLVINSYIIIKDNNNNNISETMRDNDSETISVSLM